MMNHGDDNSVAARAELIAPAGGMDAARAAMQYGADAFYLGMRSFSARSDAENFTAEELDEIVASAHSMRPGRRVYVALNTLILQDELPELVEILGVISDIGADAAVIQDLGVCRVARRHFPGLRLHASTQLAVHNREGAAQLRDMGFKRVILARELTLEEIREISALPGIETEVFIHGALCYGYSGLCLLSSHLTGRSGNRGKCAHLCRNPYAVKDVRFGDGGPPGMRGRGLPFSMKDLALLEDVRAVAGAGVAGLKIEGRMKNALYVAATTNYYRKLLDGGIAPDERPALEEDMKTIFSRQWTQLYLKSRHNRDIADRDTAGHRGAPVGKVAEIIPSKSGKSRLRFMTSRRLEVRDGLQIELSAPQPPFGFPADRLRIFQPGKGGKWKNVFEVPPGSFVETELPERHPWIPKGATVCCSASQAVKESYKLKSVPAQMRVKKSFSVSVTLCANHAEATASLQGDRAAGRVEITASISGNFTAARDVSIVETGARTAFEKLGNTPFVLGAFAMSNPDGLFVPVSVFNELRREAIRKLEDARRTEREDCMARIMEDALTAPAAPRAPAMQSTPQRRKPGAFGWSLKVDRISLLDAMRADELRDMEEIVIDIGRDGLDDFERGLARLAADAGRDKIRLALPVLTRQWESDELNRKVASLLGGGWQKWEASNLSAWKFLEREGVSLSRMEERPRLDLSADWPLYVMNRAAALQLLDMGVTRFTLSPEDGLRNMRVLLGEFGAKAVVIIYQDTPLLISESCPRANLSVGKCRGIGRCGFEGMELLSDFDQRLETAIRNCRVTITACAPYCLASRLTELGEAGAESLRADFIIHDYTPSEVRRIWQELRAGKAPSDAGVGNCDRGI